MLEQAGVSFKKKPLLVLGIKQGFKYTTLDFRYKNMFKYTLLLFSGFNYFFSSQLLDALFYSSI